VRQEACRLHIRAHEPITRGVKAAKQAYSGLRASDASDLKLHKGVLLRRGGLAAMTQA